MWSIAVPPRLHIFLWLLANGKVPTRDNLSKRKYVEDKTCLFCSSLETVHHTFFECCVAKMLWETVAEVTGLPVISDFTSLSKWWLHGKKMGNLNVVTTAALWTIWKTQNNLVVVYD
jgi:hypothetical protein